MLCSVVKHTHQEVGKKHSAASHTSRVFPYTFFVLYHSLRALQQNRAQSRLLYLLTREKLEVAEFSHIRYWTNFKLSELIDILFILV